MKTLANPATKFQEASLPPDVSPELAERLQSIPIEELLADRFESQVDADNCRTALAVGVTVYSGGAVAERLAANERFIRVINFELERRGAQ